MDITLNYNQNTLLSSMHLVEKLMKYSFAHGYIDVGNKANALIQSLIEAQYRTFVEGANDDVEPEAVRLAA